MVRSKDCTFPSCLAFIGIPPSKLFPSSNRGTCINTSRGYRCGFAVANTDLMLISHVTPDKYQALDIGEAYDVGKLVLEAEFDGTICILAFFDLTFDIHVVDLVFNANELSDNTLRLLSNLA